MIIPQRMTFGLTSLGICGDGTLQREIVGTKDERDTDKKVSV